jgi:hypothetical protein
MTNTGAIKSGMGIDVDTPPAPSRSKVTLQIRRLMATQLRLFRLEMVGQDHPALVRVGALLIVGPIVLVGYAFVLASLVRYMAIRLGWGVGLLLVGVIHLAVGAWGWRRSRAIAFTESYEVMAPDCQPQPGPRRAPARAMDPFSFDNAVTLPALRTPVRPTGRPGGVYNPA